MDAAIYYTKNPPLLDADEAERPVSVTNAKADAPRHISPHIPVQRSIFTIHADPTNLRFLSPPWKPRTLHANVARNSPNLFLLQE